jgi:xanthine dehydrogenase accessory factor
MTIANRNVLEASAEASLRGEAATLALVLETEGSTYVRGGAAALFGPESGQVGWLSGGCLEAAIAERAAAAARDSRIEWIELDTRDDHDLLAGSALGCRGRLRLVLLPLRELTGWHTQIACWLSQPEALVLSVSGHGVRVQIGGAACQWQPPMAPCPWANERFAWELPFAPLARVAVFGAGPETDLLLPLLRQMGWKTVAIERRARWRAAAALADIVLDQAPESAMAHPEVRAARAALVMHHHFEFDREALQALAASAIPFVGLLGPQRRRDDLFKLLPAAACEALRPRLHAPVGLNLGGQGAEAIALSIAAQLQAYRHGG